VLQASASLDLERDLEMMLRGGKEAAVGQQQQLQQPQQE
jgi:hypothetical protein